MRTYHAAIALVLTATTSAALLAQAPTATVRQAFEVAAIKRNMSRSSDASMRVDPGGRFRAVNAPVFWLLAAAYGGSQGALRPEQVVAAPDWLESERYDINAKAADMGPVQIDAPFDTMRPLLQSLLEDRCKLRVHRDTRQMPIYALVRASANEVPGPRMTRSSINCATEPATCGFGGGPPGRVAAKAMTLDVLTQLLSNATGRVVVDRTRLNGRFDIDLEWSPDQAVTDTPSIFTAVQEQLGLKLESTRGPVEVLVIDHIEPPTED